jgi:Fe-S-cluster containining protein
MFEKGSKQDASAAFRSFASANGYEYVDPGTGKHACTGCVAPCCSAVTLHEMRIRSFREVDYLRYVLGFERIELGWDHEGVVEINYRALCSLFDSERANCSVHETDEQPIQCRVYDPVDCEYREQYLGVEMPQTIRISRARFPFVEKLFRYDSKGNIVHFPDHEEIRACLSGVSDSQIEKSESQEYEHERAWPTKSMESAPTKERDHDSMTQWPCSGCSAWCCRVLLFPLPAPDNAKTLSFFRYLTLFPGLALAANPRGYVVQCFTTCTHLSSENQCSIYAKPERPVHCQTYDPWSCRYVPTFAQSDPQFRSLSKDSWREVEALFSLNEDGLIVESPNFDLICEVTKNLNP